MSSSASSRLPFLFPFLLGLFLCYKCTTADTLNHFCGSTGNYTANSTYQSNLDQVLSTLVSKGYRSGFTTANVGQIPDQVYGLVLCRGDVNATACRTCLDGATKDARQLCPFDREAAIWYDDCQLRYSNKLFLNSTDNSDEFLMANTSNVTDVGRFDSLLNQLLSSVTDWAADNSTKRFATGVVNNFTNKFPSIYGLVQCTPDFSGSQCRNCLQSLFNPLPDFLEGKEGGRVIGSRCNMRYEVYSFYEGAPTLRLTAPVNNSAAPPPPLPPPTAAAGGKNSKTGTVLAIVIPLVIGALVTSAICICFWRRRKSARELPYPLKPEEITNVESLFFDFSTLRAATSDFAEQNKLGQGGFGAVYKGLLPDGREIAVKKLLTDSTQGLGELRNELVLVAKLQHRNLVRLLGVSFQEEKLLVYEYVPNRSLDTILFDPEKRGQLDWGIRYKIITGIARGLQYLHEESQVKIVHRDLKASNVLLDADMNPKISDFGFAKLFGGDQTQGTTSRVVGTFGYMAPEYVMHGQYSMKSDIFSFGVMVLEILTGRKNSSQISVEHAGDLLSYTWRKWSSGIAMEILDPVLSDRYSGSEVLRCIQIALLCVQDNPSDRPLMSTVTLMLSSISATVQTPLPPAFYAGRSTKPDSAANDSTSDRLYRSSNNSVVASPNELSISEVEPR